MSRRVKAWSVLVRGAGLRGRFATDISDASVGDEVMITAYGHVVGVTQELRDGVWTREPIVRISDAVFEAPA